MVHLITAVIMDVVSFGITILLFHLANGEDCIFHGPCSCNTDNYKIDLSPIMKHNKKPLTTTYLGAIYYLDPCGKALTVPVCEKMLGPEVAGCQQEGNYAYGIAKTTGYSASGDPNAGSVVFTYSYGEGANRRTTKLNVKCSSAETERDLVCTGEKPTRTYNFVLNTKYACKHIPSLDDDSGLSTGSILVILFFVFLIVYFVGGILFLKYYRKEEGTGIIPNRDFWKELPLLVKDGFVFVIAKVRGESTYEKI